MASRVFGVRRSVDEGQPVGHGSRIRIVIRIGQRDRGHRSPGRFGRKRAVESLALQIVRAVSAIATLRSASRRLLSDIERSWLRAIWFAA